MTPQHKSGLHEFIEEVPQLCKQTFLSMETGIKVLWIVGALLLSCAGTAVAWAFTTNSAVVSMKEKQMSDEEKITQLDNEINKKLDVLINRGKAKE